MLGEHLAISMSSMLLLLRQPTSGQRRLRSLSHWLVSAYTSSDTLLAARFSRRTSASHAESESGHHFCCRPTAARSPRRMSLLELWGVSAMMRFTRGAFQFGALSTRASRQLRSYCATTRKWCLVLVHKRPNKAMQQTAARPYA